ncbi:MAG: MASE1 domain-containing protein [Pseudomonadota bacterium]|nr:MASE1 domain-containing protein [Pseudomonadota bacterium]
MFEKIFLNHLKKFREKIDFSLNWVTFAVIIILTICYFSIAKITVFIFFPTGIIPLWPSTGIAIAAMVLLGYRIWPSLWIGELTISLAITGLTLEDLPSSVSIATGKLITELLGAFLMRRWMKQPQQLLTQVQKVSKFFLLTTLLTPFISATLATLTLYFSQRLLWLAFVKVWWLWWAADVVAILIFMPLLLVWHPAFEPLASFSWRRIIEATLLFTGVIIVTQLSFGLEYPFEYFLFPLSIWAVFRFDFRGVTLLNLLVALISVIATLNGYGPFIALANYEALGLWQLFVSVTAFTHLMLATIKTQRDYRQSCSYANETKLTQILAAFPLGLGVLNQRGQLIYYNAQAMHIMSKTADPEAAIGQITTRQLYIKDSYQRYPLEKLPVIQALRGHITRINDIELRQTDKALTLTVWGAPIFDDHGKVIYALNIFEAANPELPDELNQFFQALMHQLPLVVYKSYQRPNGHYGYYYISPYCETAYGIKVEELYQNPQLLTLYPADQNRWRTAMTHAMEYRQQRWSFEGRFILPSGELKWLYQLAQLVPEAGEMVFYGVMLDISEYKSRATLQPTAFQDES